MSELGHSADVSAQTVFVTPPPPIESRRVSRHSQSNFVTLASNSEAQAPAVHTCIMCMCMCMRLDKPRPP